MRVSWFYEITVALNYADVFDTPMKLIIYNSNPGGNWFGYFQGEGMLYISYHVGLWNQVRFRD